MRKNMFIAATIVAAAIGFTACSSSKAVSETGKALNREEVEVKMTKSEELAFEKPAIRSFGDGTNFNLSFAMTFAENQARAAFQRKVEALVQTASEEALTGYQQASTNGVESSIVSDQDIKSGAFAKQLAEGVLKNTAVIHADKFKKTDGQYHVYVCIEYRGEVNDMVENMVAAAKKRIPQQVSDEDRIKIQFEIEQFKKKLEEDFNRLRDEQNR
jgi:hypothetical protein